eukprot:CCRYP_004513-RC/>CCRYP_004513-RC protein AED:0.25 eAED:0.25 QI:413/1/1/1/0.25/0/5/2451/794
MSQAPPANFPSDGMQNRHYQRPESSPPPVTSSSPINSGNHGALYARLRTQVEFYFSPQNLARDTYLRNMLTANHKEVPSPPPMQLMTPVGVITNFPKVKDICASFGTSLSDPPHVLLARACEGSTVVTVSTDGAWIGPASQLLPQLMTPAPRMAPSQPQPLFQQGPYPPSPHQRITMNPMGEVQPMAYVGPQSVPVVQNAPPSQGSVSPSSNSVDSTPSQVKEVVVVVTDMPMECNPIQLMAAFTTDTIRPKSVSTDGNSNMWFVTFVSEAEAKAAMIASSEKTIAGAPIKAKLKSDHNSAKISVASASGASLSSMSETHRQPHMQVVHHPAGHQMVQQPVPMPGGAVMYPQGAYPIPQPSPPPLVQPGVPPYSLGPHYSMPPMPMAGIPGQPFPPYPQQIQPMYPYYMPQQGQPPFPMTQIPMGGRYGPVVPPPPPRYPGPFYPYQHGPQQHNMGDNFAHPHGHPGRGMSRHFHEGGQKKSDHGGKKKKNRYQRRDDQEGGSTQQSSQHGHLENSSSPNNFATHGKGRGRQGDNFRRSTGSSSPAFNRHQRNNNNKLSNSVAQASAELQQDGKEDIFSAADFPGLGGEMKTFSNSLDSGTAGQRNETKKLSGYVDALLKKGGKEKELEPVRDSVSTNETEKVEFDSVTRETEAKENEMLGDFHELRISGNHDHHSSENNAAKDGGKEGNASIADGTSKKTLDHLPILPGMSDIGQSFSIDIESKSVQNKALHDSPNESDSQGVHNMEPTVSPGPSLMTSRATATPVINAQDKPAVSGAWGSKRLFSDVIKDKE